MVETTLHFLSRVKAYAQELTPGRGSNAPLRTSVHPNAPLATKDISSVLIMQALFASAGQAPFHTTCAL